LRGWHGKQLSRAGDVVGADAAGEQAVMADAMESVRQHVDEKAADELVRIERHRLVAIVSIDPIVFPFEGHARLVERDQSAIGAATKFVADYHYENVIPPMLDEDFDGDETNAPENLT